MTKSVIIGVVLLSLTALPVLYFLNNSSILKKETNAVAAVALSFSIVVVASVLLFSRFFRNVEPMMYAYCLFCWTAVCSLCSALEMDGFIGNFFTTFLVKGEPYMKTAHGTLFSYWDGTVHLALCLAIIVQYTRRESHRELSLFLCGSMVNSVLVLVYGTLCGPHKVGWLSLYRLPYILIPVNAAVFYLHKKPIQARAFVQFPSVWKRPVDISFVMFFKLASALAIFRGIAVLGGNVTLMKDFLKTVEPYLKDSNMFPKFQIINYDFLFLGYYAFAIYALMSPGQHWMSDWSLIHAGAAVQAQFCYIGGALHHRSSKSMHPPQSGHQAVMFWSINLLLFVVPLLFAYWCQRDPEKYGRSYTATLANPIERKYTRTTKVLYKSD